MATNSIKISYPKSGHVRGRSFAAYGKTERDVGHIKGVLKNRQGVVVQTGKTLSEGPNWVVTFEDVGPGDYTLEVSGVGATPDTSMFHVEGEVAVGVTYPPNGTTL